MIVYALPMITALAGALLSIVPVLYFEEAVSVAASAAAVASSVWILFLPNAAGSYLYIDGLSKVMLLSVSLIYLATALYSITFLKYIENPLFQKRFYYFLLNAFVLTMLFTVSVNNLGLVWVGIEATTVTSALLVATENDETTIEASWRYVIIVSAGLVISLVANIFLYKAANSLNITTLRLEQPAGLTLRIAVLLAIVGYGTKAGIFPMYTWLPDVHGKAPSPVSGIFSSVLLPVAMYAIMRIVPLAPQGIARTFALTLGVLTVATAALLMPAQTDYKRLFAYSTIENMGMILIGVSIGGIALIGALVILVAHSLAKSSVFFLSGNLLVRYGTTRIDGVRGVASRMPKTAYTLLFGSLAVTGAPPFGTFIGEVMIVAALFALHMVAVAIVILVFLALAFLAVNRRVVQMLFSSPDVGSMERGSIGTLVPMIGVALAVVIVAAVPGIYALLQGGLRP